MLKKIATIFYFLGFDPRKTFYSIKGLPYFIRDFFILLKTKQKDSMKIKLFPILPERFDSSGIAKGHYFHQDLWAARKIRFSCPSMHIDVGSRIDGFIAHLLVFMDVTVLDIRDLTSNVKGLTFKKANLMDATSFDFEQAESVSCLHTLEHFGLGRYGDPVDLKGWKKGIQNLALIVKTGGNLYLSMPVGNERIEFNAHRVFNPNTIIEEVEKHGFTLISFSMVDDLGEFSENVNPNCAEGFNYGCGLFEFQKICVEQNEI
jgi:hypothetical protein